MRTLEQIEAIKRTKSNPVQHWDIITSDDISNLLKFYNTSDNVVEKVTGPKVLKVNEDEGIINNILYKLRQLYGEFNLRDAHFFDVEKPHIIHNDDSFDYPQCYKAFVIPLYVEGNICDKAKFFVFDQSYYGGPAKFVNEEDVSGYSVHYNKFLTNYNEVENKNNTGIDKIHLKYLSHLKSHWLKGLSVNAYFPWKIGSVISFDSLDLHSASNFNDVGITRKIGLSIFTKVGK
jgi:hypothetical protein